MCTTTSTGSRPRPWPRPTSETSRSRTSTTSATCAYWFDEGSGQVFCLVEAPDATAAEKRPPRGPRPGRRPHHAGPGGCLTGHGIRSPGPDRGRSDSGRRPRGELRRRATLRRWAIGCVPGFRRPGGELELLGVTLDTVAGGRGATVLIGGDAGIGKTRLVDEFGRRARDRGSLVATGACVPIDGGGLPYAPVVGLVRGPGPAVGPAGRHRCPRPAGRRHRPRFARARRPGPGGIPPRRGRAGQDQAVRVDPGRRPTVGRAIRRRAGVRGPAVGRLGRAPSCWTSSPATWRRRPGAAHRHLPQRGARPDGHQLPPWLTRARPAPSGHARPRSRASDRDETAELIGGHPRPPAGLGAGRRGLGPVTGQRLLRRGAHRRPPQPGRCRPSCGA